MQFSPARAAAHSRSSASLPASACTPSPPFNCLTGWKVTDTEFRCHHRNRRGAAPAGRMQCRCACAFRSATADRQTNSLWRRLSASRAAALPPVERTRRNGPSRAASATEGPSGRPACAGVHSQPVLLRLFWSAWSFIWPTKGSAGLDTALMHSVSAPAITPPQLPCAICRAVRMLLPCWHPTAAQGSTALRPGAACLPVRAASTRGHSRTHKTAPLKYFKTAP